MMSYLDKTFCASPQCKNDCGRRMTDAQREQLSYSQAQYVSYGYFCGEDDEPITRLKAANNLKADEWHLSRADEPESFGA
jgi:hypothetical protein